MHHGVLFHTRTHARVACTRTRTRTRTHTHTRTYTHTHIHTHARHVSAGVFFCSFVWVPCLVYCTPLEKLPCISVLFLISFVLLNIFRKGRRKYLVKCRKVPRRKDDKLDIVGYVRPWCASVRARLYVFKSPGSNASVHTRVALCAYHIVHTSCSILNTLVALRVI